MENYLIFIASIAVLIYGADLIIEQSSKVALRFGISEYIIGATLVALGTSLPEMAASITASINDKPELAVSNIIGSNILNITLVLGLVLILSKKINPKRDFFAKDSSWALFPVLIFVAISFNQHISRFIGFAMVALMGAYILFLINSNTEALALEDEEIESEKFNWIKTSAILLIGFILVVYGADYTVDSASKIAVSLGVSQWFVGVVLVAFGTSLPELVVSVVAALKNKGDMAIGNIIGSNMANISIALGLAVIANPIDINFHQYIFDISIMVIATLMLVFITANKMYTKPAGIALIVLLSIFLEHTINARLL